MKRDVVCWKCGQVIGSCESKRTSSPKKSRTLCSECRELHIQSIVDRNKSTYMRILNSKRMTDDNPMSDPNVRKRVSDTMLEKYASGEMVSPLQDPELGNWIRSLVPPISDEQRKAASRRMTMNNPMFCDETRAKATNTLRERIDSGGIRYNHGPDHHLWIGNRDFNNLCRTNLYSSWVVPILERDGFKCTECESTKQLQVHHIKPLREFISAIAERYGIESFSNLTPELRFDYALEVVQEHSLCDGVTLCKDCHNKIDPFFHG